MKDFARNYKETLKQWLYRMPFIGDRARQYYHVMSNLGFDPGHFYSTIPDLDEVRKREKIIFDNDVIADIDLNLGNQFSLLQELLQYADSIPYFFTEPEPADYACRYRLKDAFYNYSDVIFLHFMLRHYRPARIIEVGCGSSSAVMLDTNELFLNGQTNLTFIDPVRQSILTWIRESDLSSVTIMEREVQDVPLETYKSLGNNDILFIDSSHVSKAGSDLNHILFNVLPALKPGVLIHFHDIFFPFEMPRHWVLKHHRYWNENYLLRAFLMNNSAYQIVLFNTLLQKRHRNWFENNLPDCLVDESNTGSIWIRKMGEK